MKRYKRMIADLEREVSALKTGDVVETLQTEKAQLSEALTQKEQMFRAQQSEVARLKSLIMIGGSSPRKALLGGGGRGEDDDDAHAARGGSKRPSRRETWCPGASSRARRSARRSIAMTTTAVAHNKKPRRVSTMPSAATGDGGGAKVRCMACGEHGANGPLGSYVVGLFGSRCTLSVTNVVVFFLIICADYVSFPSRSP